MLESRKAEIARERSTREPLGDDEVRRLLREVDRVIVARGPRAEVLAAKQVTPDDLRGPTGKIRAPLLRRGRTLLVGLHRASLAELLKSP